MCVCIRIRCDVIGCDDVDVKESCWTRENRHGCVFMCMFMHACGVDVSRCYVRAGEKAGRLTVGSRAQQWLRMRVIWLLF